MSDFPNFVWQHQYNRRWVTYSKKHNELLNGACKKWQKSISLPSDDTKKNIVVYLDKMYQVNVASLLEQKVRCVIFNGTYVTWLWRDDEDSWSSYRPHISCFLEMAHVRKEQKFKFFENGDYYVDLVSYKQVNETTHFRRQVTRDEVSIETNEDLGIRNDRLRRFKQMCANPSLNFQNRCMNLPSLSSTMESMCHISQQIDIPPSSLNERIDDIHYDSKIPADSECYERATYHLYMEDSCPFSAMMNIVDIKANINKFYLIQLLEHNEKKIFAIWQRFGRTGSTGQNEFKRFGSSIIKAKSEFKTKFYEKTKNHWNNLENFRRSDEKYDLLKIDLNPLINVPTAEVDLHPSIYKIMQFICSKDTVSETMREMSYDSVNAPLGSLTAAQIKDGYSKLSKIAEVVSSDVFGSELIVACEEFYMKIPHHFGKKNPPLIQTKEDIEQKLEMLEAIANATIAVEVLKTQSEIPLHPLNRCYDSFKYSLQLLDSMSVEYSAIEMCLQKTHGFAEFDTNVIDIYSCDERNSSFSASGNSYFLWHGSRLINFIGILKKGLQIAPREAPANGALFGKGLYFTDVPSKAESYCRATKKNNEGIVMLCEVALGNMLELDHPNSNLPNCLESNYSSVKGKGKIIPTNFATGVLSQEIRVPVGPLIESETHSGSLEYNEYVVYDFNQVRLKYLLRIKFNF